MEAITTGLAPILAATIAKVVLHHREFRDQEYLHIFDRNATNEETTENPNLTITVRPGQVRRKHQATPKQVHTQEAVYKNS